MCMFIILTVFYMSIGLAGCSVSPRISCSVRKLARTPRVIKKKTEQLMRRIGDKSISYMGVIYSGVVF